MSGKIFDLGGKRIYVAAHRGMVGSAIVRRLAGAPCEVITAERNEIYGRGSQDKPCYTRGADSLTRSHRRMDASWMNAR